MLLLSPVINIHTCSITMSNNLIIIARRVSTLLRTDEPGWGR